MTRLMLGLIAVLGLSLPAIACDDPECPHKPTKPTKPKVVALR